MFVNFYCRIIKINRDLIHQHNGLILYNRLHYIFVKDTDMFLNRKWQNNIYLQEIIIFIAMFILTMLHEWIWIDSVLNFFKGLAFFILLYMQAQAHRFFIFPFFLKKDFVSYTLLTFLTTFAGAFLLFEIDYRWVQPGLYQEDSVAAELIYHFVICIISTYTIMSLFLMRQYMTELQRRNQDQLLLSEMNMKFLHAQLNPHFFFNMLNNLYGVSLADPARTPGLIIKLSDLMRYQIENANKFTVSLYDEVSFIRNYIDLERERIGKRCDIRFEYPESKNFLEQYQVAPLLLIVLVENAFKHSITNGSWFVHVFIVPKHDQLEINIHNSMPDENLKRKSTGIGLNNIRQRLEFLYKGEYLFLTSQDKQAHQTTLILRLKNNING